MHFYHFHGPSMAVSGDFLGVLDISDTAAGLFVCNIVGHGVLAALAAAIRRTLIGELKLL